MTAEVAVPILIVEAAIVFVFLERRYPATPGRRTFRAGFWVDLIGYGVIQSYVMALVISKLIYFLSDHFPNRLVLISSWPIAVQVIFFIVTHDLVTYWIHRTQHRVGWLWRIHEPHHSGHDVDWLSGIRSHALEILLYETAKFLPIILLGAAPEVPLYRAAFDSIYGMFIHANLNIRLGVLGYFFNGPSLHRWHHASCTEAAIDRNFATKFAIWDILFGTKFAPEEKCPSSFGIIGVEYPAGYIAQHLYSFRGLANRITTNLFPFRKMLSARP